MSCYHQQQKSLLGIIAFSWINDIQDEKGDGRKTVRWFIVTVLLWKKWGDPKKRKCFLYIGHTPPPICLLPMHVSKLNGMNFQSTAWKMHPQIPLVVMWFVCSSAMQYFESAVLCIQLQLLLFQRYLQSSPALAVTLGEGKRGGCEDPAPSSKNNR